MIQIAQSYHGGPEPFIVTAWIVLAVLAGCFLGAWILEKLK
jgi:hypothetical protein